LEKKFTRENLKKCIYTEVFKLGGELKEGATCEFMDYITTVFYVLFLIITLFKNYASLLLYFKNKTLNTT